MPKGCCDHVKQWKGVTEDSTEPLELFDLERFSKPLQICRAIHGRTKGNIGEVKQTKCAPYLMMVKAMLVSARHVEAGVSTLISNTDIQAITGNRKDHVLKACGYCKKVCAWERLCDIGMELILDDVEVRCVMFIHQKRGPSRKTFVNLP